MSYIEKVLLYDAAGNALSSIELTDRDDDLQGEQALITASNMFGRVSDTVVKNARLDASTEAQMVINYEHHEIHAGSHYFITGNQSFSNGQVVDFTMTTPNTTKWCHLLFTIDGTYAVSAEIKEAATVDTPGTAVTPRNSNRNYTDSSTMTVRVGDTFTDEGTSISDRYSGQNKVSGTVTRSSELILKQNTVYIFRITNESTSANIISWDAIWYEHTDRN